MPGDTFLDKPEQPEQPCPYQKLPYNYYKKTTLYDRSIREHDESIRELSHHKLARDIVHRAFFRDEDKKDLKKILEMLEEHSNFQVLKVESVLNKSQWAMHQMFANSYNIKETEENYHGTKYADEIAEEGFRGALCRGSKYGNGICSSTNAWKGISYCDWEGISYCDRDRYEFKLLILSVHVGPSAGGWQDRKDFGKDANGNPILTLTNPTGTIKCSKYESQLLVKAIITGRYMHENNHTIAHKNFVGFYNPGLVKCIQYNNTPSVGVGSAIGASSASAASVASAASGASGVDTENRRSCGTVVKIFNFPQEKYKMYLGFICVIRKIELDGKRLFFFLQVVLDPNNNPVNAQDVNIHIAMMNDVQFTGYESRYRCCIVLQSEYIQKVHGAIVNVAINAAEEAWKDSVGIQAIESGKCAKFAASTANDNDNDNEYIDSLGYNYAHYDYYIDQEVFIQPCLTKNKDNKKYEKFVGWRGIIMRIMSRKGKNWNGKDFILFVKPTYNQDNNLVTFSDSGIKQLNGNCCGFLKGSERDILNKCIPCKPSHLCNYNACIAKRAEQKRNMNAEVVILSDATEQSGPKKARI